MCDMIIRLKFLDVPPCSVAVVDTDVKWRPKISISKFIDKLTFVFQFSFVGTFGLDIIQFHIYYWFIIKT